MDVHLGDICFSNQKPFVLIGGVNVLESRDLAFRVCEHFLTVTQKLGIDYVFKASFDKANRSSIHSFRGQSLDDSLTIFTALKKQFHVPIVTDVHTIEQVQPVASVCDVIQIPAFLARQTDLLHAAAQTSCVLHVKKPQFSSPEQMTHVVEKINHFGHERVLLCERGSCFGYDNLVVDMLGIPVMKRACHDVPIVFDVTHALQCRQTGGMASGGRRQDALTLAKAGVATGLAGVFIEVHPDPEKALCDGPSALPLAKLEGFVQQLHALDNLVKSFPELSIT